MDDKKYFIGLDIGTNSCGWAVTDENYNLLKAKGKKMWGVRLFEEGKAAAERRVKRTNRRRLDRRKLKIQWLQELFAEEIAKVDPNFFARLKYSSLWWNADGEAISDKQKANANLIGKDSLFSGKLNGQPFTDREYFKKYPTIYHLRESLTREPAEDIRLLYLATHNIIKRRGHFLMDGELNASNDIDLLSLMQDTFTCVQEFFASRDIELSLTVPPTKESVLEIIKNKELGKKEQKAKLVELCKATKEAKTIVESLITGKLNVKSLLDLEDKLELNFDNTEDFLAKLAEADFETNWLDKVYTLYSTLKMNKLLGDNRYICQAMLDIFATHQEQLKFFKDFIKTYYSNTYFDMFRANNIKTNYVLFVKGSIYKDKKQIIGSNKEVTKEREADKFYAYVKKLLDTTPTIVNGDTEKYQQQKSQILKWIEEDNFLPKQRTKSNAVLPNQLYKNELKKILEVSSTKYPFLKTIDSAAKDEKGQPLTTIDKILQILTFRVPYFVGPIVNSKQEDGEEHPHSWVEKKADIALRPWTLAQIVDLEEAEESFITKMTNTCTYLSGCDVLPKHSILYSKFRALNELNNLKIDGQPIPVDLKQKIFTEIFLKEKNPSLNKVKDLLVAEGLYTKEEAKTIAFTGIDKRFANNMGLYVQFSKILGEEFLKKHSEKVEQIILWMTVIEDKNRLQKRLERHFGDRFSKEQIASMKGLACSGWGRLSKEFLELQSIEKDTGEVVTILERLWNTNDNLQQILFDSKYNYQEKLQEYKKPLATEEEIKEAVANLYCSPMVKRGVLQTIKIIQEIIEILGHKPDKIFVEVTRHDEEKGEKGRKLSRHKNLCDKFTSKEFKAATKDIANEVATLLEELNKKEETALRSDKLLLYFQQLGRCIYSGEKIDLEELYNSNSKWDIDHIYPQSFIKDDSINNRVLSNKVYNNEYKRNSYPLPLEWQNKQSSYWTRLKNAGLISLEKYNRLMRREPLTERDEGQFIERQIVVTNQSAKAVIELLQKMVKNPRDVVYSKAGLVSDFRHKYNILKSRVVNDLHHAKDAYLNIVVGNVIFNRFTDNPRNFYSKNYNDTKNKLTRNVNKLFDNKVLNYTTGEVVWDGTKENVNNDLKRVIEICNKNDILVSKMSFCNYNGAFYDETVYKKQDKTDKNAKKLYPLKGENNLLANPYRYGGVSSLKNAFFLVVESVDKKGKRQRTIEPVPIILYQQVKKQFKNEKDSPEKENKILQQILDKICQDNKYKEYKLISKLKVQSTFILNNGLYWLGGKSNDTYILHNANQWYVDTATTQYIKVLEKYSELKANKKWQEKQEENGKVVLSPPSKEGNREVALQKEQNVKLYESILQQLQKNVYKLSAWETIATILQENQEKFIDLSIYKQAELLLGVIKRIKTGAMSADTSILNGPAKAGVIKINKDISDKELYLIKTSVTGLKTSKISIGGVVNGKSILNEQAIIFM